jgi:hypothetical protein
LAPLSLEQRFQQVDIELAVEEYEKLSRAMFDTQSKLEFDTEPPLSDEQRKHLRAKLEKLQQGVDQLRARARADAHEHSKWRRQQWRTQLPPVQTLQRAAVILEDECSPAEPPRSRSSLCIC